jgi:hypothetical protein
VTPFDVFRDGLFHVGPPVVLHNCPGGVGDAWVACCGGVVIKGNYPPS